MDLRIIKTRKRIREAFLNLRKNTILDSIKVKDICSLALINKTTFYKHYKDVHALNEQLENEAIDRFMEALPEKDLMFEDTERFIKAVARVAEEQHDVLKPIFHDSYERMYDKLEKRFSEYYREMLGDDADEVLITFAIGGISYTLRELYFNRSKASKKKNILKSMSGFVKNVQGKYKKPALQRY